MPEAPKGTNVQFRREWDKEEYAERAKQKDDAERERMKENEERMKQGKKPRKGRKNEGPLVKPTELMQAREIPLELDKNLNKTLVVQQTSGRGPGVPGFFCETCNRTYKDTTGYLDHINGRAHLAKLGQTTKIERSTLEQVRARIAFLREKTRDKTNAASYDFEARLAEVKAREDGIRAEKKAAVKARKDAARLEMMKDVDTAETQDMAAMMGFAGFGSSKK